MPHGTPASPVGRNDPCPCGSGRKYKNCCMKRGPGPPAPPGSGGQASPPTDPAELMRRAADSFHADRLDEATALCRQILQQNPRHAEALAGVAQIAGKKGDWEQSIRLLRQSIAIDGARADTHRALASLLLTAGRPDQALGSAESAVALQPSDPKAYGLAAACHERMNRIDDAIVAARKALELAPEDATAGIELANLLHRTGALTEARRLLMAILARENVPAALRERGWQILGSVLDRLGAYDEAFAAFVESGVEAARSPIASRFDRRQWIKRIEQYRAALTPSLLARGTGATLADDHPAPAFMVGFPRSGTTLTEQVLAAHPDVDTTGEAPLVTALTDEIARICGSPQRVPEALAELDREQILHLRRLYRTKAASILGRAPRGDVLVDKLPLNLIDLGLINVIFPDARVVVALRDPRDTCLSCFMQHFRLNAAMVNFVNLDWATEFYAEVMGFWLDLRGRLTLEFIEIRYEDTVHDLEGQARRLIDFLGVPWHDDVLHFQEKARQRRIATPSYAAVTEAVHTRAIGRWRNYRQHLEPVMDRLQPFVEAFGYAKERTGDGGGRRGPRS